MNNKTTTYSATFKILLVLELLENNKKQLIEPKLKNICVSSHGYISKGARFECSGQTSDDDMLKKLHKKY